MPNHAAAAERAPKRQRISAEQRLIDDARRDTARALERHRAAAARLFPAQPKSVQLYVPFRERACARNIGRDGKWYADLYCRCTRCFYSCPVLENIQKSARGQ